MDFYNPKGQAPQSPEMPAHQTWTVKLGIPLQISVSSQQHIVTICSVDVLPLLEFGEKWMKYIAQKVECVMIL